MKKLYRCPVKGESPLNFIKAKTLYINDIKGCSAPPINQSCSKSKSICDLSFTYHSE